MYSEVCFDFIEQCSIHNGWNVLGLWLARSPVSAKTRAPDPVLAYVHCSSLLWYYLITRFRPHLLNL